jgi:hypothetical protein
MTPERGAEMLRYLESADLYVLACARKLHSIQPNRSLDQSSEVGGFRLCPRRDLGMAEVFTCSFE